MSRLDIIVDTLRRHGPLTSREIIDRAALPPGVIRDYLRTLEYRNIICPRHCGGRVVRWEITAEKSYTGGIRFPVWLEPLADRRAA